jgi:hypothetical protein
MVALVAHTFTWQELVVLFVLIAAAVAVGRRL